MNNEIIEMIRVIAASIICYVIGYTLGYLSANNKNTQIQVSGDNSTQTQINNK